MQLVFFTKPLQGEDLASQVAFARQVGADGLDLAVRLGHAVTPDNAGRELPRAAACCRQAGLALPMVSLPTDFVDPAAPPAAAVAAACQEAGVGLIKLGYFPYRGCYWPELDAAQRALGEFERIGARYGVKFCYHTHSGDYLGCNCEALAGLISTCDPRYVGAYADAGHQRLGGAGWAMGLEMVATHLCALGVKDPVWEREGGRWQRRFVPLGQGMVNWAEVLAGARGVGFGGPVSLHVEYPYRSRQELAELAAADLALLRAQMPG